MGDAGNGALCHGSWDTNQNLGDADKGALYHGSWDTNQNLGILVSAKKISPIHGAGRSDIPRHQARALNGQNVSRDFFHHATKSFFFEAIPKQSSIPAQLDFL
jgi:hypothetical protein